MTKYPRIACVILLSIFGFSACGGGGGGGSAPPPVASPPPPPPSTSLVPPVVTVEVGLKELVFSWANVAGATHYKLLEDPDGSSGFVQVGSDIPSGTLLMSLPIAVHLQDFERAIYVVQACNASGCSGSTEVNAMNRALEAIGYFKASDTTDSDRFGRSVALSADGRTLAVGASNNGTVYLFRFDGNVWFQQADIKAFGASSDDFFGYRVALSADGNTLAVGAYGEDSNATGVNGDQGDDTEPSSGAAYVFRFDGAVWYEQAYFKASNTWRNDRFGIGLALSADGNTMTVAADYEESSATGINGNQGVNSATQSGAVYVFRFDGADWSQQAYIKASNTGVGDHFGESLALSADGGTLAVGASGEDSNATGIEGDQGNDLAASSGAVYVFEFDGTDWSQEAYVKASNTESGDAFGWVALSADGNTLAVGAISEGSRATGVNGDESDNSFPSSGAVYVFRNNGTAWSQQSYIKASNTGQADQFGFAVSLSGDGDILVIGARGEDSIATGINGNQFDNSAGGSGAAYSFRFDGMNWSQRSYIKATNSDGADSFGDFLAVSADGNTLAVGAWGEDSNARGINGDYSDNSSNLAGAAYVY